MKNILLFLTVLFLTLNIYSQNYTVVKKELTDNSKKLNYEFTLTYPQIKSFNGNIGSVIMFNDFMKDKAYAVRDTFRVWMRDWDTISIVKDIQSYYEAGDSVFYAESDLISIQFYEGFYFAGAAHPANSSFSINYNLKTGKEFTLNDLLTKGWETTISEICIADIIKQKRDPAFEPDDWLKEGAGPKANNFKVFNLTNDHLLITFPTYQIESYVAGPSEVEIPYSSIKSIIDKSGLIGSFVR